MKNKNQILYIIAGVLAFVLLVGVVLFAVKGTKNNSGSSNEVYDQTLRGEESDIAQIEPINLPDKKELEKIKLENVIQTDKINDQFVLARYEIEGINIIYYFQADAVTNGERLTVTAHTVSSPAEYEILLPTGDRVEKTTIGDYEMTFYNRMIYYVPDENTELPPVIRKNLENGHAEIRYRSGAPELVNCQSMQWYDNGIAYNMESLSRSYTIEDMSSLVTDYLNNRK